MTAQILQFPAQPRIANDRERLDADDWEHLDADALRAKLGWPPLTPEQRALLVKARAAIALLPRRGGMVD